MARARPFGITSAIAALALFVVGCAAGPTTAESAVEGIDDRWIVLGAGAVILASFLALLHRRNTVTQERHQLRERIATDLAWLLDDPTTRDTGPVVDDDRPPDDRDDPGADAAEAANAADAAEAAADAAAADAAEVRRRSKRAVANLTTLAGGASGELAAAASDLATRVDDLATVVLARLEGPTDRLRNESRMAELSERVRVAHDRLRNALEG